MSHRDYLAVLVAEDVAYRAETRIQRATRKAHFPFLKYRGRPYVFPYRGARRILAPRQPILRAEATLLEILWVEGLQVVGYEQAVFPD